MAQQAPVPVPRHYLSPASLDVVAIATKAQRDRLAELRAKNPAQHQQPMTKDHPK